LFDLSVDEFICCETPSNAPRDDQVQTAGRPWWRSSGLMQHPTPDIGIAQSHRLSKREGILPVLARFEAAEESM
jgi:hypothetical protein